MSLRVALCCAGSSSGHSPQHGVCRAPGSRFLLNSSRLATGGALPQQSSPLGTCLMFCSTGVGNVCRAKLCYRLSHYYNTVLYRIRISHPDVIFLVYSKHLENMTELVLCSVCDIVNNNNRPYSIIILILFILVGSTPKTSEQTLPLSTRTEEFPGSAVMQDASSPRVSF